MNFYRRRELTQISAHLYSDIMDKLGNQEYGHVSAGNEETIVLSELIKSLILDLNDWIYEDTITVTEMIKDDEED